MTQFPPGGPPLQGVNYGPKQGTNGMAVAGLVCAILGFCVWFLGGILGIIFGLIGLQKSRNPQVGGRGLAVSAIVIGVLSILGSGLLSYLTYRGLHAAIASTQPERDAARRFVVDLSKDDVIAAESEATSELPPADLQAMAQQLHAKGSFVDMTSSQINLEDVNGAATCHLHGVATFASGTQDYDLTLRRLGATWKVSKAQFP
jgi:hypothetical protein